MSNFSVILLAGGIGNRMQSAISKQFLPLGNKPVGQYSLDIFCEMDQAAEIIIVCAPDNRHFFHTPSKTKWALPGKRRQDSVYNALQEMDINIPYVCVHDACRPFITSEIVQRVMQAASEYGAAAAGMPVRYTIKEVDESDLVLNTPNREFYWEIQTPQIIKTPLLMKGFQEAIRCDLTVTDDTSLAELLSCPVKLVKGSYANLKITTPEDLATANILLKNHG